MAKTKNSAEIRLVIVDDHAVVREGIRALLQRHAGIRVVGEAADGKQALAQVKSLQPDVVLMDIAMPVMNGLEATQALRQCCPDVRILVLTQHESKEYVLPLLRAGAAGYILKRARAKELVEAIRAVHTEGAYLPPMVAREVVSGVAEMPEPVKPALLTEREREVIALVAEGLSSREIGERLYISTKTVDTHRANIMEKLDLHSTAELIKYAIREGIVSA